MPQKIILPVPFVDYIYSTHVVIYCEITRQWFGLLAKSAPVEKNLSSVIFCGPDIHTLCRDIMLYIYMVDVFLPAVKKL